PLGGRRMRLAARQRIERPLRVAARAAILAICLLAGLGTDAPALALEGNQLERDVDAFVTRLYREVLSREPDAGGLAGWSAYVRLHCTQTGLAVTAAEFLDSDEFGHRSLTLPDVVTVLYRALLGRDPDPVGADAWVDILRQRRLRMVQTGFLAS